MAGMLIRFLGGRVKDYCAVGISEENDAIYSGAGITNVENENVSRCIISAVSIMRGGGN